MLINICKSCCKTACKFSSSVLLVWFCLHFHPWQQTDCWSCQWYSVQLKVTEIKPFLSMSTDPMWPDQVVYLDVNDAASHCRFMFSKTKIHQSKTVMIGIKILLKCIWPLFIKASLPDWITPQVLPRKVDSFKILYIRKL
jgi:hypothetical protein